MIALPKHKMTSGEFLDWAVAQPKGRYELVRGEVVAMSPERARHVVVKGNVYRALGDAVRKSGLPCIVFPDGISVVIDNETMYEPDATVQCGASVNMDGVVADKPMIVVEVTSPSSTGVDAGSKLADYLTLPIIAHVLIIDPLRKIAFLHSKTAGTDIATRIVRDSGELRLDPPGITLSVAAFYEGL